MFELNNRPLHGKLHRPFTFFCLAPGGGHGQRGLRFIFINGEKEETTACRLQRTHTKYRPSSFRNVETRNVEQSRDSFNSCAGSKHFLLFLRKKRVCVCKFCALGPHLPFLQGMERGRKSLFIISFAILALFAVALVNGGHETQATRVVTARVGFNPKLELTSLKLRTRRLLQSSTPSCTTTCPASGQAASACSALSSSTQSTIRNNLIANCGMNTFGSSCCSSIPSDQWNNYLNCMCAGDTVLAGLTAFVNPSQVIAACGCKTVTTGSSVSFSGANLSSSSSGNGSSSTPVPPLVSPQSGETSNPVATQIIASQTAPQGG